MAGYGGGFSKYAPPMRPNPMATYAPDNPLSAIWSAYLKRTNNAWNGGIDMANAGAQQMQAGDPTGALGMVLGPLGAVSAPITGIFPEQGYVEDLGRKGASAIGADPRLGSALAGGGLAAAMALAPGPKGLGRGLGGLAEDATAAERAALADRLAAEAGQTGGAPVATTRDQALAKLTGQPEGITAYHGSPHDFDKFDMSKIGTGEGAQAYGHGLYFAGNEGVAKSYADALQKIKIGGKEIADDPSSALNLQPGITGRAATMVRELGYDKALAQAQKQLAQHQDVWSDDLVNAVKGVGSKQVEVDRHMYQVRINAHPDEFLDWDKPLSEQGGAVADFIKNHDSPKTLLASTRLDRDAPPTGGDLVRRLDGTVPGYGHEMANKLKAAGIKGIRYKDQGSRSTEGGTYNYVVFDDKLIDILKKYAIPMTAGVGGAMVVSGQNMPPQIAQQLGPQS